MQKKCKRFALLREFHFNNKNMILFCFVDIYMASKFLFEVHTVLATRGGVLLIMFNQSEL